MLQLLQMPLYKWTQRLDVFRAWKAAAALVKNIDQIIHQEVEQTVDYLKLPPMDATSEAKESNKSDDSDDE